MIQYLCVQRFEKCNKAYIYIYIYNTYILSGYDLKPCSLPLHPQSTRSAGMYVHELEDVLVVSAVHGD